MRPLLTDEASFFKLSLVLQLKEAEEKSTKLQTQLSVSHSRLTALQQRKREEREGTSVQQQVEGQRQLLAQVEALKQQLIGSHQTENIKRKTDTTFVSKRTSLLARREKHFTGFLDLISACAKG